MLQGADERRNCITGRRWSTFMPHIKPSLLLRFPENFLVGSTADAASSGVRLILISSGREGEAGCNDSALAGHLEMRRSAELSIGYEARKRELCPLLCLLLLSFFSVPDGECCLDPEVIRMEVIPC